MIDALFQTRGKGFIFVFFSDHVCVIDTQRKESSVHLASELEVAFRAEQAARASVIPSARLGAKNSGVECPHCKGSGNADEMVDNEWGCSWCNSTGRCSQVLLEMYKATIPPVEGD